MAGCWWVAGCLGAQLWPLTQWNAKLPPKAKAVLLARRNRPCLEALLGKPLPRRGVLISPPMAILVSRCVIVPGVTLSVDLDEARPFS